MLPVYRQLLEEDIKILVYSGDVDAIVPGQQPCQQPPGQVCQPAASKHACADGNGSMVYCWSLVCLPYSVAAKQWLLCPSGRLACLLQ